MRLFYTSLVIGFAILFSATQSFAQSGLRTGGFSGGVSGATTAASGFGSGVGSGVVGVGGGGSLTGSVDIGGFSFDSFDLLGNGRNRNSGGRQPNGFSSEELAELRTGLANQQFKQSLIQLGFRQSSRTNSTQNRVAYAEAQKDYRVLRTGKIAPGSVGAISVPFRLTNKEINRAGRSAKWPKALRSPEFKVLVDHLNDSITNNAISTKVEAEQFLADLKTLNQSLNSVAASGRINIKDYSRSRRFITGLANEVRASDLIM